MEKYLILKAIAFLQFNFDGEVAEILFDKEFDDTELDQLENVIARLYRQVDEGTIAVFQSGTLVFPEELDVLN